MKTCTKCDVEKAFAEFHTRKASRDGYKTICKACATLTAQKRHEAHPEIRTEYGRKYRAANGERRRQYNREYYQINKEAILKRQSGRTRNTEDSAAKKLERNKWREVNPDKYAAQRLVAEGIRAGRLVQEPCEECGDAKSHAHHDDYNLPLDIRWLCSTHQSEWHRHNRSIRALD